MNRLFPVSFCLMLCIGALSAQEPAQITEAEAGVLTPEQALQRWQISDVRISQDGSRVAFVVAEAVKGTKLLRHVWVYEVTTGDLRQFTNSAEGESSPRWSPDGQTLAFLSSRSDNTRIFLLSMRGGEGRALTDDKYSVRSYAWSPEGDQIAFLAAEPKSEEEVAKEEAKDDARVVDHDKPAQIWMADIGTRLVRQLTEGHRRISEYAWLPPGGRLLLSATDDPQPELETNSLFLLDVASGESEFLSDPPRPFGGLQVSPNGRLVAFSGTRRDGPTDHDLWVLELADGQPRNLTATSVDRPIGSYLWLDDHNLLATAASGFSTAIYRIDTDGSADSLPSFEVAPLGSFAATSDMAVFVGETTVRAPELWVSRNGEAAEQVTHFNADWDESLTVPLETFQYSSFDGTVIEAGLLTPRGAEEGGQLPLVVLVHGGPAGRWADRFHSWGQLLAARGYSVFYPNIRGSTGYGHDFLAKNYRDWGGADYQDVMAGVEYLIEQGIADPDRLGIGGWSYGGYMAAWAVTQTNRFKASVSGAPMTDLASEYGTESAGINAYDTWYMGTPYENLDLFIERSPVAHASNATTPTLILCGENDVTDPIGQCQQFFRGLKRYEVETELVLYPREGHGIREEKHQLDVLNRMLEWFEEHLSDGRT